MNSPSGLHRFQITTGSRLHFGLYRFAPKLQPAPAKLDSLIHPPDLSVRSGSEAWFGGVGLMIQEPSTCLEFEPNHRLDIQNDTTGRVMSFVERWFRWMRETDSHELASFGTPTELPLRLTVRASPPQHCGLGAGTQLALATGQGLSRFFLTTELAPEELARSVGRGLRSAVGTHGFFRGGLIVDRGKYDVNHLGVLDGAFRLPTEWRIVLMMHRNSSSIHGSRELQAFDVLPEIPREITQRLQQLSRDAIVPSLLAADFDTFSESIYEYGVTAGHCFSKIQGGPFASARAQSWVEQLRNWGFRGVGQSSWGPTLFCFTKNSEHANFLVAKMSPSLQESSESVIVTQPQVGPYQIRPL
ncbi:MAG: hypothetical protein Q8M16_14325 [Pirellulaceae bacterium]|nr:hypothetical protein [Pirellulaceae bacterium]